MKKLTFIYKYIKMELIPELYYKIIYYVFYDIRKPNKKFNEIGAVNVSRQFREIAILVFRSFKLFIMYPSLEFCVHDVEHCAHSILIVDQQSPKYCSCTDNIHGLWFCNDKNKFYNENTHEEGDFYLTREHSMILDEIYDWYEYFSKNKLDAKKEINILRNCRVTDHQDVAVKALIILIKS